MSNYDISIDLLKLPNTVLTNIKGKQTTKKCIVIPVEDVPSIYVGEKGVYLHLVALELANPQYKDSHCIKADVDRKVIEGMSEEERKRLTPILGGMHTFGAPTAEVEADDEMLF